MHPNSLAHRMPELSAYIGIFSDSQHGQITATAGTQGREVTGGGEPGQPGGQPRPAFQRRAPIRGRVGPPALLRCGERCVRGNGGGCGGEELELCRHGDRPPAGVGRRGEATEGVTRVVGARGNGGRGWWAGGVWPGQRWCSPAVREGSIASMAHSSASLLICFGGWLGCGYCGLVFRFGRAGLR